MDLTDYLTTNRISNAEFATRIGVSQQALYRYRLKQRRPEWAILLRISDATDGSVTANDFLPEREPTPGDAA